MSFSKYRAEPFVGGILGQTQGQADTQDTFWQTQTQTHTIDRLETAEDTGGESGESKSGLALSLVNPSGSAFNFVPLM